MGGVLGEQAAASMSEGCDILGACRSRGLTF